MIFVLSGGGGTSEAYAVISVSYPAGSTCTCSNGSKVLRATDTSGSYLFAIPEAGTWTLSCTDGAKTASKTVNINSQYQAETVSLMYSLILYETGSLGAGASIKYNNKSNFVIETGVFSTGQNTQISFLPIIHPGQFNTLYITLEKYNNTSASYMPGIGVLPSSNEDGYVGITDWKWPAITRLPTGKHNDTPTTASVDISNVTEDVYAYFQTSYTTGTISKIWLE